MHRAIILHSKPDIKEQFNPEVPSPSNAHWYPWLQKQLLIKGIQAQAPEVPEAHRPIYGLWQREFERFDPDQNTILIGHSCGAGFIVRWLSENDIKVNKVFLVAPWLDPDRNDTDDFFEFKIESKLYKKTNGLHILYSQDEPFDSVTKSTELLKKKLVKYEYHAFKNKGHFIKKDMGSTEFPELVDLIIS